MRHVPPTPHSEPQRPQSKLFKRYRNRRDSRAGVVKHVDNDIHLIYIYICVCMYVCICITNKYIKTDMYMGRRLTCAHKIDSVAHTGF